MFSSSSKKGNQKGQKEQAPGTAVDHYPCRLNFYDTPPKLKISLEQFEQYALDRMQVLSALLTAQTRKLNADQFESTMNEAIRKYMPMASNGAPGVSTNTQKLDLEREKDYISHFILRLAYSRSEELRSWFLRAECALFKFRFEIESQKEQIFFMENRKLNWKKVSDTDKENLRDKLESLLPKYHKDKEKKKEFQDETYFEVDFERVTELVGRRQVYVQGGKAYVPMRDQVDLVLDEFRQNLAHALEVTGLALPRMDEDDRLMPVLNNINKQYLGREFTTSAIAGEIQAQDVDNLKDHMPLCMENLHDELRRNKHLKHWGRIQYGLFLKGIGLSLEQALIFWQMAFEKLTPDQFTKQYAYNIRHSYGLEGKRTDYTPHSCRQVIQNNPPGPGDHHGCPFRYFSAQNLKATLAAHNVDEFDIHDITTLVQNRHYQIACTRYFEVTRARLFNMKDKLKGGVIDENGGGGSGIVASLESIEHPNQFFEQSFMIRKAQGESTNGQNGEELEPTVKGQYHYRRAGLQIASQHDMEM
ncbi:hypothetical protein BGX34_005082 [Mortierella sp. NVP85]|nr:hypothetical protein BGX34_005082 [Mortierella sp. NVP85]